MVEIHVETDRRECVTFVAATVANDGTRPREVTLETGLETVWAPRRQGHPEAGWDGDAVTLVVPAGGTRGIGFASPDAPESVRDAVGILSVTAEAPTTPAEAVLPHSATGLVRTLGDPTPPGDAVPSAETPPAPSPKPPRAVAAWFDALEARDDPDERDRKRARAVADRAARLLATLEAR
ncbi:hypothetical protein [Haloarchaeobius sp. HME9146]|uniref:DUF7857 domain-containing protein n=1 Tax=Haloarchaeobius sp. HME9146 TaxID=2978732 RepID=UPI0021C1CAE6|nr:hypothetical protein [Haloarchaeobius sp. HME9146]MCT9094668.1 hypothetical protein [Haloarchaeobius sp. HME9146]